MIRVFTLYVPLVFTLSVVPVMVKSSYTPGTLRGCVPPPVIGNAPWLAPSPDTFGKITFPGVRPSCAVLVDDGPVASPSKLITVPSTAAGAAVYDPRNGEGK